MVYVKKIAIATFFFFLIIMPALAATGTIYIVSSIPGVQIELDGIKYQKDIYTETVTVGTHIVRAFYRGEDIPIFETTAIVKENESTSVLIKREAPATETKAVEFKELNSKVVPTTGSKPVEFKELKAEGPSDFKIGVKIDAKSAAYVSSVAGYSSTASADPMLGLGVVFKKHLGNDWSLLLEALFNTGSGFNNAMGGKTNLQVHPLEANIERGFGSWYLGGGINYSFWYMSASGNTASMQNGLGSQFFGGWNKLFSSNSDLEIKYTYMTASISQSGVTINTALGTLSIGVKVWP